MKYWLILVLSLFILNSNLNSKIVKLPDLINPKAILIDKDQVFICDGPSIYIYSLNNFTLKKKFGKAGEGPQEFRFVRTVGINIGLDSEYIIVSSISRVSFFSRNGDFVKIINPRSYIGSIKSLGKRFVGDSVAHENGAEYRTINIYSMDFNKKKEIFRKYCWNDQKELDLISYTNFPIICVNNDKIFVNGNDEIYVFDSQGKKVNTISHNYEKIEITNADKKNILDYFQTGFYKNFMESFGRLVKFSKYFPAIRTYTIADQKIYVATYKVIEGKREFFIFDVSGKFLKKTLLPLHGDNMVFLHPYTIYKHMLYQLLESTDGDKWELHITEIK